MLVLDNVGRRFGNRWAVRNMTAQLLPGQVVGFLGPNGAGKTTTIRMIAGILVPSEGRIVIDECDVSSSPMAAKARLAYIPDRPFVPERLSARELLLYIAGLYGLPAGFVDEHGLPSLSRFGLAGRENDLLATYSHGMRQRALLAAAFMRNPRVLLVDEPMVGLDPQGARLVKRVLRETADAGATVLMSTHTLSVVEEVCDRAMVMRQGRLVADFPVAELHRVLPEGKVKSLEELFLALTGASEGLDENTWNQEHIPQNEATS
jgi:ABC-2 type transport system ATP-binding protein